MKRISTMRLFIILLIVCFVFWFLFGGVLSFLIRYLTWNGQTYNIVY